MADTLRVLFSFREPSEQSNPYVILLTRALSQEVEVSYFSWQRAFLKRADIFHVHWPETLLRGRNRFRRAIAFVMLTMLLVRLRLTRTRIVRTLHNVKPHEEGPLLERWALQQLDRHTTAWIVMNEDEMVRRVTRNARHVRRIPHGHFRDWYSTPLAAAEPPISGQMLVFGQMRAYKGIETLLTAFESLPADTDRSLVIAGAVHDDQLLDAIRRVQVSPLRFHADLRFITDVDLVSVVHRSELIVLPYSHMLNSGALIAALSLDRPVLVPSNAVNHALAQEVGDGWVLTYVPPLTGEHLEDALAAVSARGADLPRPNLGLREWADAAAAHIDVYREASTTSRRRQDTISPGRRLVRYFSKPFISGDKNGTPAQSSTWENHFG